MLRIALFFLVAMSLTAVLDARHHFSWNDIGLLTLLLSSGVLYGLTGNRN